MTELSCDICGRKDVRAVVLIEGAKMLACGSCMRGGKVLHRLSGDEDDVPLAMPAAKGPMAESKEIVDGYGRLIKSARDRMKVPMAVIAEKISEKESYLEAIENERMVPTFAVAKKLEKELRIKLIEEAEQQVSASVPRPGKFTEPTLADALMHGARKKKKEG